MNSSIILDSVSVRYHIPIDRISSFKDYALRWLRGRVRYQELWALKGVDLEICRGEVFGLIGPNGAGKTTLLKVIAQILHPTNGRVRVYGQTAPLLELGAGFDPELTGRENIILNGLILGKSYREISMRLVGIADFAGLRQFLDAPLRTYSTGMIARLGFAIATDVEPEILLVDEILAVGDTDFQQRSAGRMLQFRDAGATIVLVAHNLALMQSMCARVAWLEKGVLMYVGESSETVARYQQHHEG